MRFGLLIFIVLLVAAGPPAPANLEQSTSGWCSPAQNGNGNTVVCNGIDPRALARLNELLDLKDLDLKQKTVEAEQYATRYLESKRYIAEVEQRLTLSSQEMTWVAQAKALLQEGNFQEVQAQLGLSRLGFLVEISSGGLVVTASRRADQKALVSAEEFLKCMPISELNLSGSQVSDLQPIEELASLKVLDISNTRVQRIESISSLMSLASLDIAETDVEDLSPLRHLTNLRSLRISDISTNDLGAISHLKTLSSISISGDQAYDTDYLRDLPNLKTIYIPPIGAIAQRSMMIYLEKMITYRVKHGLGSVQLKLETRG